MVFKHKIIQWNCRGLKANYYELLLLLTLLRPSVSCLQETHLKPDENVDIKDFHTYNYVYSGGQRPSSGSSILLKSSIPHREIKLKTELQAVAVSVSLDKETTICSVYIPLSFSLKTEQLESLLKQLPSPYILVDDFYGHNILWGCKNNNNRGEVLENFITRTDLCLMNDKSQTYLHPATGHFSSLDLSLCRPSLLLDYDWSVCDDQHGSDHFQVLMESVICSDDDHNQKWKFNKANWELFHTMCDNELSVEHFSDI